MNDVARVAGVSHQTVSRVLNDHPSVRPETADRVRAAIAQLGYRRNTAARALVTSRSGMIGLVTASGPSFGPTSTLLAVEQAAREAGYFVSMVSMPNLTPESTPRAMEHFLSQGVEGVVVIAPMTDVHSVLSPYAEQVPVVTIAAGVPAGQAFHPVSVDQRLGARQATRHLLELGHRDIVHIAGPGDWLDARERIIGWREELANAGIDPSGLLVDAGAWESRRGYEVGRRMAKDGLPSAVFTSNDQLALGFIRAAVDHGASVPGDVSVIGFDDIEGADCFLPPLTTMRQEFRQLGQRSIAMLLDAMEGLELDHTPIAPRLIVRASTGPARA